MLFINGDQVLFDNTAGGTISITSGMAPALHHRQRGLRHLYLQRIACSPVRVRSASWPTDCCKLNNGANTFTGTTSVTGGRVILGNAQALQNSAYDTTGSNGSTIGLDVTGHSALTIGGLSGSTDLASAMIGYGSVTSLTLNPQSGSSPAYSGAISSNHPDPHQDRPRHPATLATAPTTVGSLRIGIGADRRVHCGRQRGLSVRLVAVPAASWTSQYNTSGGGTLANSGTLDASLGFQFCCQCREPSNIGTAGNYSVANYGKVVPGYAQHDHGRHRCSGVGRLIMGLDDPRNRYDG